MTKLKNLKKRLMDDSEFRKEYAPADDEFTRSLLQTYPAYQKWAGIKRSVSDQHKMLLFDHNELVERVDRFERRV